MLSYFRSLYDWYYDIDHKIEIVKGDFNPKNNVKCGEIIKGIYLTII